MSLPHAGFAAVSVVSEALVNQTLATYLNTFAAGRRALIRRTVPGVVSGTSLVFQIVADAALLSVRARLIRSAHSRLFLTFRFYAETQVQVFPAGSPIAIGTYVPEIAFDVEVEAALVAQVQGDHFQFGVDLPGSYVDGLKVVFLAGGGLPSVYLSDVVNALQSQDTRNALVAMLHNIPPNQLLATPAMLPTFYDFTVMKPLQPAEVWASARVAVSRIVHLTFNGAIVVGIDVLGFTNGSVHDFRADILLDSDIASFTNLDFIQTFLANNVLPQMQNAFLQNNFRIDRINRFEFLTKVVSNGTAQFIELDFDCSFWTHDFLHFVIAGTTKISGTEVTMQAAPYLYHEEVHMQIGRIEADLPDWVDAIIFGFSLILPPITLFLPAIVQGALTNALADATAKLNGKAAKEGLSLRNDFVLPGTLGPVYRFSPDEFWLNTIPTERVARLRGKLRPLYPPEFRIQMDGLTSAVRTDILRYEIGRNGGLPLTILAYLSVPTGLVQKMDPTVRISFDTYLNGNRVPSLSFDSRYFKTVPDIGGRTTNNVLDINTITIVNPTKLDQEVRVTCRLYRLLGGVTQDFYNGTAYILSVDPRPDDVKPYVQWAHQVRYWNGYKKTMAVRRSKIHKAPGKGGCRFSNQYLLYPQNTWKFVSRRRFTGLPFEMKDIEANRDKVCPYCFFGGPDKHPAGPFRATVDLTGTVGKLFKP